MNTVKGVTLIELMVTIAVLAILVAITIPSFTDLGDSRRLVNATEAIYNDLQFVRSEAAKRTRQLTVKIEGDCLIVSDQSVSPVQTLSSTCMATFPGVGLSVTGYPITFDRVRGVPNPPFGGTITLTSAAGRIAKVIVSKFGRVLICSPTSAGGYPSCK